MYGLATEKNIDKIIIMSKYTNSLVNATIGSWKKSC